MGRVIHILIGTVTQVSIKFVQKEERKIKRWSGIQNRTQNTQRAQHRQKDRQRRKYTHTTQLSREPADSQKQANRQLPFFFLVVESTQLARQLHTDGGAVIRQPGSAWLEGTPAMENQMNGKRVHMYSNKQDREHHTHQETQRIEESHTYEAIIKFIFICLVLLDFCFCFYFLL